MSEPYSILLKVAIDKPSLVKWLDAPMEPVAQWSDWPALGDTWFSIDWSTAPKEYGTDIDEMSGHAFANTHRQSAERMLFHGGAPEALEICRYDEATKQFTFAIGMFDEGPFGLLWFLTWARSIAPYLSEMQSGYAVAHNYLWGNRKATLAVLGLGPDQSMLLEPKDAHAKAYGKHVDDAIRSFDAAGFDEADIDNYQASGENSRAQRMLKMLK